jgi:DMSO/TMAO reductase YedYZ molybdopterin-dependent catalytic subunit
VVEVAFEGADGFVRSLPVAVARHPDTLLATSMNGWPVPRAHGGPLRLVVPAWYGMASVKWLRGVVARREAFRGHFQIERYVIDGEPIREMRVRAVVTEPAEDSTVARGQVRLAGYAWSGAGEIDGVAVSDDGGRTWLPAQLVGSAPPYGWTRWEADWRPRAPGSAEILARAGDRAGNLQPLQAAWNELGYCNNAAVPHRLSVA